jgi:hypothetical protein
MKGCIKGYREANEKERFREEKKIVRLALGSSDSRLTSSKAGVGETPARKSCSPSSILALFGEEARGLLAGVDLCRSG